MRDFTPSTDTPPVEVLERFEYGFITYGKYQLYWLRRIDDPDYRSIVARLAGVDLAAGPVSDEEIAAAYHDYRRSQPVL